MRDFLFEIGTEELPASFLKPAAEALERDLVAWFKTSRIAFDAVRVFYTPRRLAIRFTGVAEEQEAETRELQGPPKKAAFDAAGNPTKTALGFARTHGKEVSDLLIKPTPKGEYVFVVKTIAAKPTAGLLTEALPGVVAALPFPKNMRWAEGGFRFARPIRWLVALLGSDVVPFKIEDVASGNVTLGHRGAEPRQAVLASPSEYETTLARLDVLVAFDDRRRAILEKTETLLAGSGTVVVPDDELLDETTNTVEAPTPLLCRFADEYLALPPVVVITALKKHQRCFAVQDSAGNLRPEFMAISNTPTCSVGAVRGWYEKAAESRLRDARFFIDEDLKIGLDGFVAQEQGVVWIDELGTLRDKTERIIRLCGLLADAAPGADSVALARAAKLCKGDLLTNMVREKEYTSLQGVIGGVYARRQGDSESVGRAVGEHYAPRSVGDPLPGTVEGRLLSVADKLDNIGAAFITGKIPTGSVDPYAIRRQATGVLNIILESGWRLDLRVLLGRSMELLGNSDAELRNRLEEFFRERLSLLLADRGVKYDVANAVLAVDWHDPADALVRTQALADFRDSEEFKRLAVGQKRVANILKGIAPGAPVETKLFVEEAESALYNDAHALAPQLAESVANRDYRHALELVLSLRPVIDRFF